MNKIKIVPFFEYVFLIITIIYAGNANELTHSLVSWENPLGIGIMFLLLFVLVLRNNIKFKKTYFKVILVFCLFFTAQCFKFGVLHPKFFMIWIFNLTLAYVIVNYYGFRFFILYEKILVKLCLISLVCFSLLLAVPALFTSLLRSLTFFEPAFNNGDANIFIYTIMEESKILFGGYRNAGFSWEPGTFASFIILAIFCNLLLNRFKIFNKNFIILLISLISCFSSTGFILLILLLYFNQKNGKFKHKIFLFPFFLAISLYIFSLPFVFDKITDSFTFDIDNTTSNIKKYDLNYSPQRFESFAMDFIDFLAHPVIGYGGHQEARWTSELGIEIGTISGIGKVFAKYGLFGVAVFFMVLYQTSIYYSSVFQYKGKIVFLSIIFVISISYSLIEGPLFLAFWMYSLLSEKKVVKHQYKQNLNKMPLNEA
jgi:hypothetical protein